MYFFPCRHKNQFLFLFSKIFLVFFFLCLFYFRTFDSVIIILKVVFFALFLEALTVNCLRMSSNSSFFFFFDIKNLVIFLSIWVVHSLCVCAFKNLCFPIFLCSHRMLTGSWKNIYTLKILKQNFIIYKSGGSVFVCKGKNKDFICN